MLTVEQIYDIREMYFKEGKSMREISRLSGYDRETVKRYVEQEDFSVEVPIRQRRSSKTDAYREQVRQWLIDDETAPSKQRHTAKKVYDRLREEKQKKGLMLDVSDRSIRSLVAELRRELFQQELVSLPLLHPAGEAQGDFGKTIFYERGIKYEGYHFCMTLPHSDAKWTQLFKGQDFECLARGMIEIFEHIGGVPTVIRFDNMSTAVKEIKTYGGRELTESFRRLQCHFGFENNFCNPAAGHEKGSVESFVGCSRRNFFVPVPEMADLRKYNQELLLRCDSRLEEEHYKLQRLVKDLFAEDQSKLLPLAAYPFDACRYVPSRTDNYGMARYQTNRYSTAGHFRRADVTLKVDAYTVTVLDEQMQIVVRHPRLYCQKKESMIWTPYLEVLGKRPMAIRYSGFYEGLPQALKIFLDECDLSGRQQVLQLLSKESQSGDIDTPISLLTKAVALKPTDADSLISAYAFVANKPLQVPKGPVSELLPDTPEYTLDLSVYGQLLGGGACLKR